MLAYVFITQVLYILTMLINFNKIVFAFARNLRRTTRHSSEK